MKVKFKFSFIIPHKNCPDLLRRCVDSIPQRDDIQILVVDDNSEEGKTPNLNRKDVDIILLDVNHSRGAGGARNVGLEHAKGKWILFADADDYYMEGFIDVLDAYSEKNIDVLYFNFIYKDGLTSEELPLYYQEYFKNYDGSKEYKDKVRFHHYVPWTKMVSHDYIKKNKISFEETMNGNDILFSMKVGSHTENVLVERRPLYVYIKNENSILTSKETAQAAMCRLIHMVKLKYFYLSIGHPEWCSSIINRILSKTHSIGFSFVFLLLKNMLTIVRSRKEWVSI